MFKEMIKISTIGLITIGQSPRVDLKKDIVHILRDDINIIEIGILDDYTYEAAAKKFSPEKDDVVYVSRMRDGKQIKMGRKKIIPLIQSTIDILNRMNVDIIALLCTGVFPNFNSNAIFVEPQRLVHSVIKELSIDKKVGIVVPDQAQLEYSNKIWSKSNVDYSINVASPYLEGEIDNLYNKIKEDNIDFIYLDCIGYSVHMKNKIRKKMKKPVILPRNIVANILNELA